MKASAISEWFDPHSRNLSVSVFLLVTVIITFALTFWRLELPDKKNFDEVYYVPAARDMLQNKTDPNWVHPPLAKFLMSVSIAIFGDNTRAWRIPSVLACVIAVAFMFLLALDLFGSPQSAFLTSLIYLMDGLTFVHARIAMLDMMMVGFLVPAIYFFKKNNFWLCGLFLGLSITCKWTGIFALPFFALIIWNGTNDWKTWRRLLLQVMLLSLLLYSILYRMTVIPLKEPGKHFSVAHEVTLAKWIARRHYSMLKFHFRPVMTHTYHTSWWRGVLVLRPTWYYYHEVDKIVTGVVAMPNPLFWWPALLAALLLVVRLRDPQARFIFFGSIIFTCFWSISTKGIFIFYFLPAAPFLVLALMYWIHNKKLLLASTFLTVLVGFSLFFPIYADWPITRWHFDKLMWFKSWI